MAIEAIGQQKDQNVKPVPNVFQRIYAIMQELSYIEKGDKTVNGQYRFVSHDQVTARIHPLLVKHRLVILPTVTELIQTGNRTQVKLEVVFVNIDVPTDLFQITSYGFGLDGKEGMGGDKGPGKAISYAYKYALLKAFCLETGDDPDNSVNIAYEPAKCQEFDVLILPQLSLKDGKKLDKFLQSISSSTGKHVEDIKREAMKRPNEFLESFKKFTNKKEDV